MPKRTIIQKHRKSFTRFFVVALVVLLLFSKSYGESKYLVSDILFFSGAVLIGIATVGRLWCSLYISGYKERVLVTQGPYSMCRHPLYFFNLLGGLGVGLASETATIPLVIVLAFFLYYRRVIKAEEKNLLKVHGESFENYVGKTPRFWPSFALLDEPEEYEVNPRIFRKRVFDALGFVWILGLFELIEALHECGLVPIMLNLY